MKKDFEKIIVDRDEYDQESKDFIDSIRFIDKELGQIEYMKRTEGWKILERKTREELQSKIRALVENDPEVRVLLALLNVADTKTQRERLDAEVDRILPESTG